MYSGLKKRKAARKTSSETITTIQVWSVTAPNEMVWTGQEEGVLLTEHLEEDTKEPDESV